MNTWIGWLLLGVLFIVMMRFGCGAHMFHGHGKDDEGGTAHAGHGPGSKEVERGKSN